MKSGRKRSKSWFEGLVVAALSLLSVSVGHGQVFVVDTANGTIGEYNTDCLLYTSFILFPSGIAFLVLTPIATLLSSHSDDYFIQAEPLLGTIWFVLTIGTYGFLAWYGWAYLKTNRKEVIDRCLFILMGILFFCVCGWLLSNFLIDTYWNPGSW